MEQDRLAAFTAMLDQLQDGRKLMKARPWNDTVDEALATLLPFLMNPEQHRQHARAILDYAGTMFVARSTPAFPGMRSLLPLLLNPFLRKRARELQALREELLAQVDPGQFQVSILPIRPLKADQDWLSQNLRLVQLETQLSVFPAPGLDVESLSHRVVVHAPSGAQFVDAIPSTEVEDAATSEWTVSRKGKFVQSESVTGKLSAEATVGVSKGASSIEGTGARQRELEYAGSVKDTRVRRVHRVISSALGTVAQWELLPTPTQVLKGGHRFFSTVLVPGEAEEIEVDLELLVRVGGWGPSLQGPTRRRLTLPPLADTDEPEDAPAPATRP